MPPRIMTPPTARLTSRLCNRAFLRSAFKAQKPLRSRAKKYSRAWESHTRKSKEKENLSFKLSGGYGVGGGKGSDKHTRYSNSPSCLLPTLSFLIEGRYSSVKGIATDGGRGGGVVFLCRDYLAML